ncbi:hypothetical protein [Micromonospora tulbaghiae]|uniref:hypothetical protein n=1 Tax=Micromonospora tulbaghiae TaxID=479978 RepID=UPI00341340B1
MDDMPEPHDHQPHVVPVQSGKGPTLEFAARNFESVFFENPCVEFTFRVEGELEGELAFSYRTGLWGDDIDKVIGALVKARDDAHREAREYGWEPEGE